MKARMQYLNYHGLVKQHGPDQYYMKEEKKTIVYDFHSRPIYFYHHTDISKANRTMCYIIIHVN